jgi:hypothetical protein
LRTRTADDPTFLQGPAATALWTDMSSITTIPTVHQSGVTSARTRTARRLAGVVAGVMVGVVGLGSTNASADSSDLNVWRSHFGTSMATTGDVDGRDFLVWQRHQG